MPQARALNTQTSGVKLIIIRFLNHSSKTFVITSQQVHALQSSNKVHSVDNSSCSSTYDFCHSVGILRASISIVEYSIFVVTARYFVTELMSTDKLFL